MIVTHIETTRSLLSKVEIIPGQLIICDDSTYWFDNSSGERIQIGSKEATELEAGVMSTAMVKKLNGIAAGAQVNTITGVKGNKESTYRTGNVNISYDNLGNYGEANLAWGGRNIADGVSPVDAALISDLGANRMAFQDPELIVVEYSTDGGETWENYNISDSSKTDLVTTSSVVYCGGSRVGSDAASTDRMVRVTFLMFKEGASVSNIYFSLSKIAIYCNIDGTNSFYTLERATNIDPETFYTVYDKEKLGGTSGWNIININNGLGDWAFGGNINQTTNVNRIRLTFGMNGLNSNGGGNTMIMKIYMYGKSAWRTTNSFANTGHLYYYDYLQNATFPAKVTATSFSGATATSSADGLMARSDKAKLDGLSAGAEVNTIETVLAGTAITVASSGKNRTINHGSVTTTASTATAAPAFGERFTAVDTVTTNAQGHVTDVRTKTITVPTTAMTGATSSAAGSTGLVPAPATTNRLQYLRGDGTWATPTNTTYSVATTTTNGLMSAADKVKVDGFQASIDLKAPLASPALTGVPTAPTAAAGTSTTQIATTEFVSNAMSSGIAASDAMIFKGTLGTSGTVTALPTTHKTGWTYRVVTAGTYAGNVCEVGDLVIALTDRSASGNTNADWTVVQTNIDGAITTINGSTGITVSGTGSTRTLVHASVSNTPATSTATPAFGGTFTAIDSVTINGHGHVTGYNTKTITVPNKTMTAASASAAGTTGLVPAPGAGKQASFLRGDGTWVVPTNTTYSSATTSAAGLMSAADKTKLNGIETGAQVNTIETITAGTAVTVASSGTTRTINHAAVTSTPATSTDTPEFGDTVTAIDSVTVNSQGHVTGYNTKTITIPNATMTGATSAAAGDIGLVPAPATTNRTQFLRGDGTWATPTNTTYSVATASRNGLMHMEDKAKLDGIEEEAQANVIDTITAGTAITVASSDKTRTINHASVSNTPVTSTAAPAFGGTVTAIDSVTVNSQGHVTAYNTKTITVPNKTMTGASNTTAGSIGLVPAPGAGKQGNFLRGDGTWAAPADTTYSVATTSSNGLMSSTDKTKLDGIAAGAEVNTIETITAGTAVTVASSGTTRTINHGSVTSTPTTTTAAPAFGGTVTAIDTVTVNSQGHVTGYRTKTITLPGATMGAASASAAGTIGLVPAPAAGSQARYLRGDGTWAVPTNTTYSVATTTANGLMSAADKVKVNGFQASIDLKAPLASPALTGTPTAPTAAAGTSTTQIATTAFVNTAISNGIAASDAMIFKGTLGSGGNVTELPTTYKTGWTYRVVTAGTYAGNVCEVGDLLIALVDRSGSSNTNADWTVAQTNINGALTSLTAGGSAITISGSGSTRTISHASITATNTSGNRLPGFGETFTTIDGITINGQGHVTAYSTKTVTVPNAAMTGATTSAAGATGLVPAPATTNRTQFLRGDGTWATPTNTTYSVATTSSNGLMSSTDKTKLDGIAASANNYVHPSYTAKASGLYKVTVDATGHVSATTAVAKADITALGIPAQDTTYSAATTTAAGLLSAADKTKLNGIATSAEVNQNAFSNVAVGTTTIAASGKTDTVTLTAGTNVTLTPNATTKAVTIAASDSHLMQNTMSESDYIDWRPVLVGYSKSATEGFNPSSGIGASYVGTSFSVQPSTGTFRTKNVKATETVNITDKVTLQWNSTTNSLDFVFA